MNEQSCRQLEEYLADSLSDDDRVRFESHLKRCGACRAEFRLQQAIDEALRSGNEATALPDSLAGTVQRSVQTTRKRRAITWSTCAAAAALIVAGAVAWRQWRQPDSVPAPPELRDRLVQNTADSRQPAVPPESATGQQVFVTFPQDKPAIAAPVATEDPTVTIFLVYPVYTSIPVDAN